MILTDLFLGGAGGDRAMAMRRTMIAMAWLMTAASAGAAWGQVSASGLLPPSLARRNGLERIWHTQIEVDRGRGRVVHVTPYVNRSRVLALYEVTFDRQRYRITENDLNPFGERIGPEGAKLAAEAKAAELQKLYPGVKTPPTIEPILAPEITLYASTNRSVVHAIDGETGKTRWVANFGNAAYPTTEVSANDTHVSVINGSTLYVFRSKDGEFQWQKRVDGTPAAGTAMTDEYIFAPMASGAMESYAIADPKQPPWIYRSIGRAVTQPAVGLNSLAWPTDRGHLYVAATTNRAIRYRLEAKETIISTPVFAQPDRLLVTSIDGYIYCLNPFRQSSNISWQFSTGEAISRSPVVIGDRVFAVTDDRRLFAVSLKDGTPIWTAPADGVVQILSATKDRIYAVGGVGHLLVLESSTGARLGDIPTIEFDLHVLNPLTDRIYVGSRTGLIQCLRELPNRWPMFHQEVPTAAKPKPKVIQKPVGEDGDGAKPKGGDDPFGGAAGDDPFGGAAPKPKADDAGDAGDDPFGGDAKPAPKPTAKPEDDPFG